MDTAQILLVIVVVILTVLLIILGMQVYFILRELRNTVLRVNKILDDAELITQSIAGPVSKLSSLTSGLKTGAIIASALKIIPFFQGGHKHKHHNDEEE